MRRLIIGALAALATIGLAATAGAQTVGIGSLPQGSLGYAIAAAVAKVVSENTDLQARAVGQGGSNVYLPQVSRGELEFGTSNTFEAIFARNGRGNFEGRPQQELRMVTALVPFRAGIMVRRDSDIQTLKDLEGRPFPTDYTSQKLVSVMLDAALAMAGMTVDDLERVPVPNFVKGAELLASKDVDGVLLSPGSAVVAQADAQVGVRFISLPDGPEARAALQETLPSAYLTTVEPGPGAAGVTEPATMMGYEYVIVAGAHVPDDVVYAVVKALHENPKDLAAAHGIFNSFEPRDMAVELPDIEYHPGAVRYFQEQGIGPAER